MKQKTETKNEAKKIQSYDFTKSSRKNSNIAIRIMGLRRLYKKTHMEMQKQGQKRPLDTPKRKKGRRRDKERNVRQL